MVDKKYNIEQELERFLGVPLKLRILRECLLYLFFKMANDTTDITWRSRPYILAMGQVRQSIQ